MKKRLKICFVIPDTRRLSAWYFETIKKVSALNNTVIHFLILKDSTIPKTPKISFAFRLFQQFENWWFASDYDANKLVSVEHLLDESNTIIINTNSFALNEQGLEELQLKQFDMIYTVDFDGHKIKNFPEGATHGLWYIKFGHGKYSNLTPPAFSEVIDNSPVIGSYLLCRKNEMDTIIYEGSTTTIPYSVKNTFNSIAWKSSSYFPNRIYGLLQAGENFLSDFTHSMPKQNSKNVFPGNFKMLFLFIRNLIRYITYKIKNLERDQFTLLLTYENFNLKKSIKFQPIQLPKDRFYADPFVIEKGGINYIFMEEFVSSKNKAHISVIEVASNKKISCPKLVLDKPYHLSYPFVFSYNNEFYMIPETSANNSVELYKAKQFPGKWDFVMYLIQDRNLIDVTLHFENGLWWMFANSYSHPFASTNDQLFLFYSKNLFSTDWKSHPHNPVVTHIDNCRPAGRLFKQNGKLYRPAQNNASRQYGYGLKINEIIVLNENQFEEKEVYEFDISKLDLKACHHFDFTNSLTVIDGILK